MKLKQICIFVVSVSSASLLTVPVFGAEKLSEIAPNQTLIVWESEQLETNNDGDNQRMLLGTLYDTYICSVSETTFYRHGDANRGALGCRVRTEGANWYLEASGPSHNKGTAAGAASSSCRAICIGTKLP